MEIEFPFLTPMENRRQRMHGTKIQQMNQQCRNRVLEHFAEKDVPLPKLKTPVNIWITRHSSNRPDDDNLTISAKPILDALVALKMLPDDSPEFIACLDVDWEQHKQYQGYMTCTIDEGVTPG